MNDAMFYALTIPVCFLLLSIAGYLWNPKVKWKPLQNKNGENGLFHIAVDPNARHARAVLAQEIAERRWRWSHGFGIPGLQLILQRIPAVNRAMEIWGHEVEVQAVSLLYTRDEDEHRRDEAWAMAGSESYEFKSAGWSAERIERKMQKRSRKAEDWVRRNRQRIETA